MIRKNLFLILLSVFTAAVSVVACIFAFNISAKNAARATLDTEINSMTAKTEIITADSEDLKKQISEVDAELSERDAVNGSYMESKKVHDSLAEEISALQGRIAQLDSDIEKMKENSNSVSEMKKGRKYTLIANSRYLCPMQVPAGRYVAEGRGLLTVLRTSGRARISQNLTTTYNHSYTFELLDGETIQVSENVTLTELK